MKARAITVPLLLAAIGAAGATAAQGATAATHSYTVKLSGSVEVPKGPAKAGGTATVTVQGTKVCWTFHLTGVSGAAAAHIHAGGAGVAGPIVIPLGAKYKPTGCTTGVSKTLAAKIVAAPKKYYVNVHNKAYPGGAVRSQL